MIETVKPVVLPPAPPVPQRNDPSTFETRADDGYKFMFEQLPPALEQLSQGAYANANISYEAANTSVDAAQSVSGIVEDALQQVVPARDSAWAAAAAAQTSAGLPVPLVPGRVLGATGPNAVDWVEILATGDVLTTNRELAAPEWLPCDGSLYLQSSYPELYASLGIGRELSHISLTEDYFSKENLVHICYGDGLWLAISNARNVYLSLDGMTWSKGEVPPGSYVLNYLAYIEGKFVIACSHGRVLSSTDGMTWQNDYVGQSANLYSVAYATGRWIATAASGIMYDSLDGVAWTRREPGLGIFHINSIVHADGKWVVVGTGGNIAMSSDGLTWSLLASSFRSLNMRKVMYENGLWMALGANHELFTAVDPASTWTEQDSGFGETMIRSIAYDKGRWVAVGDDGKIATSEDGVTWTQQSSSFSHRAIHSVFYGEGRWVCVGEMGKYATSEDGLNWSQRNTSGMSTLFYLWGKLAATDGKSLMVSDDGESWKELNLGANLPSAPVYESVNGTFLIRESGPSLPSRYFVSNDGENWTYVTNAPLGSLAFADERWMVVRSLRDREPIVGVTTDGLTWVGLETTGLPVSTGAGTNTQNEVHGLLFWKGEFLLYIRPRYTGNYQVYASADGIDWTVKGASVYFAFDANNMIRAVGDNLHRGTLTSQDGLEWVATGSAWKLPSNSIRFALFDGFYYVVLNGYMYRSTDPWSGEWESSRIKSDVVFNTPITDVYRVNGVLYAYGTGGKKTHLISVDGIHWEHVTLPGTWLEHVDGLWVCGPELHTSLDFYHWTRLNQDQFSSAVVVDGKILLGEGGRIGVGGYEYDTATHFRVPIVANPAENVLLNNYIKT